MVVAAYIESAPGQPSCLAAYLQNIMPANQQDRFVIFGSKELLQALDKYVNCTTVLVSPAIKNSLLLHYWFQYKLPILLRKHHADVFLSESHAISLRTQLPQLLVISELIFQPKTFSGRSIHTAYLKKLNMLS